MWANSIFSLRSLKFSCIGLSLVICIATVSSCTYNKAEATDPLETGPAMSYQTDIKPIIATHCYSCHSATATDPDKIGYAFMDDFEELKSYALKPSFANAAYTSLQARLRFIESPGMPFKKAPLSESDIKKIESWIKAGAPNN